MSDMAVQNVKLLAATFFGVIIYYFSQELPRDSPFDNPPTIRVTDPVEDTRFNMLDGYPETVEQMTVKKGSQ